MIVKEFEPHPETMQDACRLALAVENDSREAGFHSDAQIVGNLALLVLEGYARTHRAVGKADIAIAIAALVGRAVQNSSGELRRRIVDELEAVVQFAKGAS